MPPRDDSGVKSHLGVLGRQMPPGGIGASNATWGYWGIKCHSVVLGRQRPHWYYKGVKGHTGVKRPASRFMRSQRLGCQGSGGGSGVEIRASGFMSSKIPGVKGDESPKMETLLKNFRKSEVAPVKSGIETNFIQISNLNLQDMIPNLMLEYQKSIQKIINLN